MRVARNPDPGRALALRTSRPDGIEKDQRPPGQTTYSQVFHSFSPGLWMFTWGSPQRVVCGFRWAASLVPCHAYETVNVIEATTRVHPCDPRYASLPRELEHRTEAALGARPQLFYELYA
jgi:hypothetical protein